MVEEKRRQREEVEAREQQRLFRPAISDASAILLEARPERQRESALDKVDRLAYVDAQRREGLRLQLQAAAHEQCTFRPQIDAISARLARTKTDAELSSNSRGRERRDSREQLVRDYEQQALAECTFRPKVDARSESLAEQPGLMRAPLKGELAHELTRRLEAQQLERGARLERSRREAEHDRLKECTFAPKIHRSKTEKGSSQEEGSPVVVRGLGRYMELKDMAKRQAEAQRQREQKAFIVAPPARLQPFTVPAPFNLSEARLDERGAARLRELAQHEMQECTFAPKTNEASATQLLARVMQHTA